MFSDKLTGRVLYSPFSSVKLALIQPKQLDSAVRRGSTKGCYEMFCDVFTGKTLWWSLF